MMKPIRLRVLIFACFTVISCAKNDDNGDPADPLTGTRWQATLLDENPATNPSGEFGLNGKNQYYSWQECHVDDTFIFGNERFSIENNGTVCEDGLDLIFKESSQPYSYDVASKQLTIGTGDDSAILQVYELNEDRLKIGITVPAPGGTGNIVFLFKKK